MCIRDRSDGIGDTIRVSLSEDPEAEIPVARKLVDYILEREGHEPVEASPAPGYDPVSYTPLDVYKRQVLG